MKKKISIAAILGIILLSMSANTNASSTSLKAGKVNTKSGNLNVRASNSTSSTVKAKLKNNSYVTVLNEKSGWYYVEYKENNYGYVHKDYLDIVSTNSKIVNSGSAFLNVRSGPSTSYSKIESINNNDKVVVLKDDNYWSYVLFEGNKTGYVSKTYLKNDSYKYPSINLNVASYKQFDSRWASKTVPNTSKTLKQIGCLITALSMTESYRTGSTITPVTMINKSSFTSTGSIYWPKNYTASTTYSNYFQTIYNKLKEGKPVLLGCKNSSGNQHWVVVYGYKGSNSLTASNFLIHDPGSSSRTTLSEFIKVYSKFYKMAYYK